MEERTGHCAVILVAVAMALLAGCSGDKATEPAPVHSGDKAKEPAPVLFDIPALVGKSIDGVREILGKPQDKEPEPTKLQLQAGVDEWNNVFLRDGQELLVTFNPRTRQVIDFFLDGEDKMTLMQQGNLAEGAAAYRIEPVRQIRDRSKITGIKIIPSARRPWSDSRAGAIHRQQGPCAARQRGQAGGAQTARGQGRRTCMLCQDIGWLSALRECPQERPVSAHIP